MCLIGDDRANRLGLDNPLRATLICIKLRTRMKPKPNKIDSKLANLETETYGFLNRGELTFQKPYSIETASRRSDSCLRDNITETFHKTHFFCLVSKFTL